MTLGHPEGMAASSKKAFAAQAVLAYASKVPNTEQTQQYQQWF